MTRSDFERLLQGPINTEENVKLLLKSLTPSFRDLLADEHLRAILQRVAMTAILSTPKLMECTGDSLKSAIMKAARTNLMPDGVEAAMIPFGGEAVFVPMYQGLVKLAYNHPRIKSIMASVVCERDHFEFDKAKGELSHIPPRTGLRGKLQGVYFKCEIMGGGTVIDYMTTEECDVIKAKAPGARKKESPWNDMAIGYPRMCEKTVLIRNKRWIPKSDKLDLAMSCDDDVWRRHSTQPQVAQATITLEPGNPANHTHPGEPFTSEASPAREQPEPDATDGIFDDAGSPGTQNEARTQLDAKWAQIIDSGLSQLDKATDRDVHLKAIEEELVSAKSVVSEEVYGILKSRVEAAKAFG